MSIKKFICAALAVAAFSFAANAEVHPHALGLRGGFGGSLLGEVNYQMGLGSNRLEIGVRIGEGYFGGAAFYQLHWNLAGVNGLNWYAGLGACAGVAGDAFGLSGNGQIGIEYDFKKTSGVPILLSLDTRPGVSIAPDFGHFGGDYVAFGIRWIF